MEEDRFMKMQNSMFYRFFDRISQLIVVNCCMIVASLCGLVVFGLYPATFAAAAYFNDQMEGVEQKTFSAIMKYFKQYFLVGNVMMLLTVPTIALGFYAIFFNQNLNMFFYFISITWMITVYLMNLYMPAVNVLYPKFSIGKKLLFSLVAACDKWKTTGLMTIVFVMWILVATVIPQFSMFVMLAVMPWFFTWRVKKALRPDTIVDPTAPIPEEYHEPVYMRREDFMQKEEKQENEEKPEQESETR